VTAGTRGLRVLGARGLVLDELHDVELDASVPDGRYTAWLGGLLPGSYSIEVRASDGRSATGELRVLDLAEDDTPLVPTLP
jgi:hypothetical protein